MEAEWQTDRSLLRDLIRTRPDLSLKQIAAQIGRSYSWAKKWAKRLAQAPPEDLAVLHSRSRARKTPAACWDPLVLRRVEQIRLWPPEGLQRTPGPKAILYDLPRDEQLRERGCRLPRSTRTVWKFLHRLGSASQRASEEARAASTVPAAGGGAGGFQRCQHGSSRSQWPWQAATCGGDL